ncbi:hypothetical protein BDA99DRAFT_521975 [Phascolomyces articulosus]|uniref:Autophagy-related protein 29 n=1 Tax=Phascolomyces articulosus TaxID=60185 RepID=A0AAD5JSA7_9FUNG|nr:hypothetical protein BDA99DRAFT_521975 [Phascolomyces articulosus]
MTLEKDTLHVVIRLPFKRPPNFVEPPPILWTDEMEQQLRQYMSQKHTDWNYIAEQLRVPSSYLIRHAAFIYETQLLGIKQFRFLNEVGKTTTPPPPSSSTSSSHHNHRRNVSSPSRPPSRRQTPSSTTPTATIIQQQQQQQLDGPILDKGKSPVDSMMLSTISNIAPRNSAPTPQQQYSTPPPAPSPLVPPSNDIASVIEESLYTSFASQKSSRTYYSPQQSMGITSDSDKDKEGDHEDEDEDEEDAVEITEQFQNLQMEEEPAFLPVRTQESSSSSSPSIRPREQRRLAFSTFSSRSNKPSNHRKTSSSSSRAGESTGSSLDWSDSSITQSALEDALLSKFNHGSKMSSLALSRKYPTDQGKSNDT